MKFLCLLLCVASASCFYVDNKPSEKDRIVGGVFTDIKQIPYQASLIWYGMINLCGATIIDNYWIVTAAHCVENKERLTIRTGTYYRTIGGTVYEIQKVYMHPEYDTVSNDNDIALIKLEKPIEFNDSQQPIPIANSNDIPREGQSMKISGFGKIHENLDSATLLKSALVPVTDQEKCKKAYERDPITDNMFCAGVGVTDACQGDSGGPGVINSKLYGVVSSGMKCASKIYPGVYTRVHLYYDWIVKTTGIKF